MLRSSTQGSSGLALKFASTLHEVFGAQRYHSSDRLCKHHRLITFPNLRPASLHYHPRCLLIFRQFAIRLGPTMKMENPNVRTPSTPIASSALSITSGRTVEMLGTQQDAGGLLQICRDDEKACGQDEPLHFFSLPIELRHRIYELVFGKSLVLRPHESDDEVYPWTRLVDGALFSMNKFLRAEAMGWFFANNSFVLNYEQTGMGGVLPSFFSRNRHGQRSWLLENLKRLRIEIALYRCSQRQHVENTLIEICDVLANCTGIVELRITCFSFHISYEPWLDAVMDELLERFCVLRGIGNVWFTSQSDMAHLPRHSFRCVIGTEKQKERVAQLMMAKT